jgi:lysophospholipase L1-like esterase
MSAKLVAIGDSLTQGFQSGSISKTNISYPAILAKSLQVSNFPIPDFSGAGGLPLNIEALLNLLARRYGASISWLELLPSLLTIRSFMDRVEDYWERGDGSRASNTGPLHENTAVWGFQLADCYTLSEQICRHHIPRPNDDPLAQIPEFAMYRTARRTLNPNFTPQYQQLTQIGVAQTIAQQQGGIDNLIFWLGANHCLGTVINLKIKESDAAEIDRLAHQRTANFWKPEHFQVVLERAAEQIAAIGAKHVFIANVPHVTIPPVSRGITPGAAPGQGQDAQGYYEYYTHFWIWDSDFSPGRHPYLTRAEVRHIDETIDAYNQMIQAKAQQMGWHLVDMCKLLDQLAFRRLLGQITYQFPTDLVTALKVNPLTKERVTASGQVLLDSRYLRIKPQQSDPNLKFCGGLFSLDGVHPTTIAYGIVAHEFLQVMQQVWQANGETVPIQPLDWDWIVAQDTLVTQPPANLENLEDILGFLYSQTPLPELMQLIPGFMF